MELVTPRTRVVTDDNSLTWLEPDGRSTRVRHAAGTLLLALLVIVAGATATLFPPRAAVPATAAVVAAGAWVLWSVMRGAASRLALSPLGLYLEDGTGTRQVGWPALRAVTTRPAGRRLRVSVDDGHRCTTTRASFEGDAVRHWLRVVAEEATRRQLEVRPDPDGPGFRVEAPRRGGR